jgi:hypothetical protein
MRYLIILLLTGCVQPTIIETESEDISKETNDLLAQDKKNKLLELEYLEQIRLAQENNDTEAFKFFLQEYIDVDRLEIPEELKKDPNYFQGGQKVKY